MNSSSGYGGTSSSSGALLQLLAVGKMDEYLSKNASKTHWRHSYNKTTPFSIESVTQSFSGSPAFSGESQCCIARAGDLLWKQYIKIVLPGLRAVRRDDVPTANQPAFAAADCNLTACADRQIFLGWVQDGYTDASDNTKERMLNDGQEKWQEQRYGCAPVPVGYGQTTLFDAPDFDACWWTECAPLACLRRIELRIGGSVVDVAWSELLYILDELSGKSGLRCQELIGRTHRQVSKLVHASREEQTFYVPMPWYFTGGWGNGGVAGGSHAASLALPICALQFHNVSVNVQWQNLAHLIIKSHCDIVVLDSKTGQPINDNSLKAELENVFIHLDTHERDSVISHPGTFLITQHAAKKVTVNTATVDVSLGMSFCVTCMFFVIRRRAARDSGDLFNFAGIGGRPALESACLNINNASRVAPKPEPFWRLLTAYQHFSSMPLGRIYSYSFALDPLKITEPSGSLNMSRLDSCNLELALQPEFGTTSADSESELFIFCRNWNVLTIKSGLASLAFSS